MSKLFPAVSLYANSHGNGAPILNTDGTINETVAKAISRFQLITLNVTPFDSRADVIANLRAKNPNIKIIAYSLLGDYFPFATVGTFWKEMYDTVLAQVNGVLYGTDGLPWLDLNKVNFGNVPTCNALKDLWNRRLVNTGIWDGAFLDCIGTDMAWASNPPNRPLDYVRAGFLSLQANDQARRDNFGSFCDFIRIPNFIVISNGTTPPSLKNAHTDGTLFEGWQSLHGTFDQAMAEVASMPLPYNMMELENYYPPYSSDWNRTARYGLATACMNDTYFCNGPARNLPSDWNDPGYLAWWPDEFSVTPYNPGHTDGRHDSTGQNTGWLGESIGSYVKDPSGLLRKAFPNGCVLLNPTSAPIQVDLGAPYWRRIYGVHDPLVNNGLPAQKFTMPPMDGLFLISTHHTLSPQQRRV